MSYQASILWHGERTDEGVCSTNLIHSLERTLPLSAQITGVVTELDAIHILISTQKPKGIPYKSAIKTLQRAVTALGVVGTDVDIAFAAVGLDGDV